MTKNEFLIKLMQGLSSLPTTEIEERVDFYSEMIDDRIEEGLTEEEAVAAVGSVETVIDQIITETPFVSLIKEKMKHTRRLRTWEIVLLAVGSPIWISLLAAAFAVTIALYASLWAVAGSLWAVPGALIGGTVGCILACPIFIFVGNTPTAFAMLGAGLVCGGLAILSLYGCKATTQGAVWLTKKVALILKKSLTQKEEP